MYGFPSAVQIKLSSALNLRGTFPVNALFLMFPLKNKYCKIKKEILTIVTSILIIEDVPCKDKPFLTGQSAYTYDVKPSAIGCNFFNYSLV